MGKIVFVELLDRRGHVRERFRLETFPASIGRAYSNTVIIDDRLACPEHLRVYLDEQGAMVVEDLESVNGMCLASSPQRLSRHIIPPGKDAEIRVGNTLLRFRGEDYIVGPAEARRVSDGVMHGLFEKQGNASLIFLFSFGCFIFSFLMESHERMPGPELLGKSLVFLLILLIWAGFWSFLNRLMAHTFRFVSHLALAGFAAAVLLMHAVAIEYYAFLFSAALSADIAGYLGTAVILSLLLYSHLSIMLASSPRRRMISSALAGFGLVGVIGLLAYVSQSEFSNQLRFSSDMKPVGQQWMRVKSPDKFFEDLTSLRKEVDTMAEKEKLQWKGGQKERP